MKSSPGVKQALKKPMNINNTVINTVSAVAIATVVTQSLPAPIDIYNKASPSVVTVTSIGLERDPFAPRFMLESVLGSGSGFSYKTKEYIITNAHVVKDAFYVKVNSLEAQVIGMDETHDIAVVQVSPDEEMRPLSRCRDRAKIGETVLAIGNPFGFEGSMTSGIISGLRRSLDTDDRIPLVDLLQTDAAINPGNSGGPLLDARKGCVLGVNTAIVSSSGSSSGVGLAIPIDVASSIMDDLVNGGTHKNVQLGITLLPDKYSNLLGIQGVIIADVLVDGPANKLHLQGTSRDDQGRPVVGDVILEINNTIVKKKSDLYKVLTLLKKGDTVKLVVLTNDGVKSLFVTL